MHSYEKIQLRNMVWVLNKTGLSQRYFACGQKQKTQLLCAFKMFTFMALQNNASVTVFRGSSASRGSSKALFGSRSLVAGPPRTLIFVGARPTSWRSTELADFLATRLASDLKSSSFPLDPNSFSIFEKKKNYFSRRLTDTVYS